MELIPPPTDYPDSIVTRAYRVVFWQHQLPEGDVTQEDMGWSAFIFDFDGAKDVHEVIEWAESHFDKHTNAGASRERGYVLYAHVPGENWMLHIAGVDPTISLDAPPGANLSRAHPLSRS